MGGGKMAKTKHWWEGKIPTGKILVGDDYGCTDQAWLDTFGFVRIQDLSITDWDDYLEECLANIIDYPFALMKERIGDAVVQYCPDKEDFKKCYETSKSVAEKGKFLDSSNVILKILNESYKTNETFNLTYAFGALKNYDETLEILFSSDRDNFNIQAEVFRQAALIKRRSARNLTKRYIKDLPKNYDEKRDRELSYQNIDVEMTIEKARIETLDREIESLDNQIAACENHLAKIEPDLRRAEEDWDNHDYLPDSAQTSYRERYEQFNAPYQKIKERIYAIKEKITEIEAERQFAIDSYQKYLELRNSLSKKGHGWDEDPVSM